MAFCARVGLIGCQFLLRNMSQNPNDISRPLQGDPYGYKKSFVDTVHQRFETCVSEGRGENIVKTISILTTLVKTNHPEPLTLEIPPPLFNIT